MPVAASPSYRHVFVYGTLRRGQANDINRLDPPPRYVGTGVVQGQLFNLGRYPGVVLGSAGPVHGEIYTLEPLLEARLDEIEGIAPKDRGEYRKRQVRVAGAAQMLDCLVYELNPGRAAGKPLIAGGDWVQESSARLHGQQ